MRYRFATDADQLPAERVADLRPGEDPGSIDVIIRPGHATRVLLEHLEAQRAEHARWCHLPDTAENRAHPRRLLHAGWQLIHPEALPEGALCTSLERPGRHDLAVREGHATPLLVAELTLLLRRMVRTEVWVQREADDDASPAAA
jgi:hypothetical protein